MIYEATAKASDTISRYISVISSKKELVFKQFINAVLVFIILLVFGCLDFATLKFHYEYLLRISYWTSVVTKVIAGVCALNVGINFMHDLEIKKDQVLAQNIYRYENLNNCKDNDFDFFVEQVYNKALKVKNYISQINLQIFRLNKHSKKKDRILFSSSTATPEEKAKNKYCIKRQELETLKSDEFINANIESLNVKFESIDPAIFELEIDGTNKIEKTKVRGSMTFGRVRASATVIMGMVAISMLTSSFALEADKEVFENEMVAAAHYCLKAVSDIGVVLWQLLNGMLRTRGIVSSQLTTPFANRVKILMEYYQWREKNGKPVPQFYKDLLKEQPKEEFIELEVTQSEYEEIKKKNEVE